MFVLQQYIYQIQYESNEHFIRTFCFIEFYQRAHTCKNQPSVKNMLDSFLWDFWIWLFLICLHIHVTLRLLLIGGFSAVYDVIKSISYHTVHVDEHDRKIIWKNVLIYHSHFRPPSADGKPKIENVVTDVTVAALKEVRLKYNWIVWFKGII